MVTVMSNLLDLSVSVTIDGFWVLPLFLTEDILSTGLIWLMIDELIVVVELEAVVELPDPDSLTIIFILISRLGI